MNKMSSKQAVLLIMSTVFSPAVRLFSSYVSGKADQSGWIAPLIVGITVFAFSFVISSLLKNNRSFYCQLKYSFGNVAGKVFAGIYLVWGTLLVSLQTRYYAQRVASSIYSDIDIGVFVIIMAGICIYALRNGVSTLARMNEIILPIMTIVGVALLAFLTPDVDMNALIPINNMQSIAYVTAFSLASFGYITLVLFFTDDITAKEEFKKYSTYTIVSGTLMTLWLFVDVIGNLGHYVVEKLPYPFFAVVKQISVGEFLQHIEAFIITLWILSDFITIAFISSAMLKLLATCTHAHNSKEVLFPYFALVITLVPMMGRTSDNLEVLSEYIFVPGNIILLFAVPIAMLIGDRIRQKRTESYQSP